MRLYAPGGGGGGVLGLLLRPKKLIVGRVEMCMYSFDRQNNVSPIALCKTDIDVKVAEETYFVCRFLPNVPWPPQTLRGAFLPSTPV